MDRAPAEPQVDDDLTLPGRRSGHGAQSVLPYLMNSLQAKHRDRDPPDGSMEDLVEHEQAVPVTSSKSGAL
jgi:hypothetical protein